MKKILIIITIISTLLLCSCGGKDETTKGCDAEYNVTQIHSEYFDVEILEEGDAYYIVRDKHTGYKYLVVGGSYSAVMTRID